MASPLQIILNDKDYQEARDAGGGGLKKDFFANRDREFREHKKALSAHAQQPAMPMMRRRNPVFRAKPSTLRSARVLGRTIPIVTDA
jgi:hypothetical protein